MPFVGAPLRTLTCDAAVLLLAAVLAMWARSHRYADMLALRRTPDAALTLESRRGELTLSWAAFRTRVFAAGPADDPAASRWACEWLRPGHAADDGAVPGTVLGFGLAAVAGTGWMVAVPYWAFAGVLVGPAVARARRAVRHRRDVAQGLCPSCGYDLRATPERCPECGTVRT
jgi:hypothetical protein